MSQSAEVVGRPRRTRRPTEDIFENLMEAHMNTKYGSASGGDAPLTLENFGVRTRLHWSETRVAEEVENLIGGFTAEQEQALTVLHNDGHAVTETISFMEEFNGNGNPDLFPKKDRLQIWAKLLDMLGDPRAKPCRPETKRLKASTTRTSSAKDMTASFEVTAGTSNGAQARPPPPAPTQPRDRPSNGINSGGASAHGLCGERSRCPFQAKQASISTTPGKMSRSDRVYPSSAAGFAPDPAFANTAGQVPQGRSTSMPPPSAKETAVLPIFGAGLTVRPTSTDAWASSAATATVSCTSVAVQPISSVVSVNSAAPSASLTGFAVEPASAISYASSATPAAIAMDAQPASTAPRQGRPKGNNKGKACLTTKKPSASAVPATGCALFGATIESALPSASRRGRPPKALEFGIKVSESREVSQKLKKEAQVSIAPAPASHTNLTPSAISTFRGFGHQRASPTSSNALTPPNATVAPNVHGTTASTIGPALSDLRITRPHAPPIVDAPPKPSPWSSATVEAWRRFGMADNEEEEPSLGVLGPLGATWVPEEISNLPPPVRASDGPPDLRWVFPDAFEGEGSGRFGVPTFEEQQAGFDELFFPDPACDADASWIPSSMTDPCAVEEQLSNPDDDMEWLSAFDNDEWLKG